MQSQPVMIYGTKSLKYLPVCVELSFMVFFPISGDDGSLLSEVNRTRQKHTLWSGQGFSAFIDIKNIKVQ